MPAATTDFDEATPPPRQRPEGAPIPRLVTLPPGESVAGAFGHWDSSVRIPVGCVLAEWVGSLFDPKASGYEVSAVSSTGTKLHTELGAVGGPVPPKKLAGYALRAEVVQGHRRYVVFAPRKES